MDYKDLANLIFPNAKPISYYEEKYPERNLPEGAMVVRFAPSPTGYVHIGGLYQSIICTTLAKQTKGVSILRIEDTDQKRLIENGVVQIVEAVKDFGIVFDEGMINEPNANTISAEEIAVADSGGDSDDRAAAHLRIRHLGQRPGGRGQGRDPGQRVPAHFPPGLRQKVFHCWPNQGFDRHGLCQQLYPCGAGGGQQWPALPAEGYVPRSGRQNVHK